MLIRFDQSHGPTTAVTPWSCYTNAPALPGEIVAFGLGLFEPVTRCERTSRAAEYGVPILEQIALPGRVLPAPPDPLAEIEQILASQGVVMPRRISRIHAVSAVTSASQPFAARAGVSILQIEERLIDDNGRVVLLRRLSCCDGTITVAQ